MEKEKTIEKSIEESDDDDFWKDWENSMESSEKGK